MKIADLTDLDPAHWREYDDILTDSLWRFERRDDAGEHAEGGQYHGNFIPQIPNQLLRRFTKPGDWVCDPFAGGGTTLIEAARLNRNAFGIDLNEAVLREGFERALVQKVRSNVGASMHIAVGDAANPRLWEVIAADPDVPDEIDFLLMHPPYHDIVKFNPEEPRCLGNCATHREFLLRFNEVLNNLLPWLKPGRFGALVIGDYYREGEWITLGDDCWRLLAAYGMKLKGKIVKNIGETAAKGKNTNLWRRRALTGGFYVFKHEYVYVFQKPEVTKLRANPAYRRPVSDLSGVPGVSSE